MRKALALHPDSRCDAVTRIEVEVVRQQRNLMLTFVVTGTIGDLSLPAVTVPARTDELWRHTCFEAFVRANPSDAYHEFNFAPSTQWAAYRFDSYRVGMAIASEIAAPQIEVQSNAGRFDLKVSLESGLMLGDAKWHLALSAVIEDTTGRKSYWALAHPPGKPDFHHADGFALELPTA
jgi:hypothetical protein